VVPARRLHATRKQHDRAVAWTPSVHEFPGSVGDLLAHSREITNRLRPRSAQLRNSHENGDSLDHVEFRAAARDASAWVPSRFLPPFPLPHFDGCDAPGKALDARSRQFEGVLQELDPRVSADAEERERRERTRRRDARTLGEHVEHPERGWPLDKSRSGAVDRELDSPLPEKEEVTRKVPLGEDALAWGHLVFLEKCRDAPRHPRLERAQRPPDRREKRLE
jgi:hypothetical protein